MREMRNTHEVLVGKSQGPVGGGVDEKILTKMDLIEWGISLNWLKMGSNCGLPRTR